MKDTTWGQEYLKELEAEVAATRKCLERIPDDLFKWKPHNKSMDMGTLAFIVADIPRWITTMVKASEIDFVKFKHDEPKTTGDLVKFFDEHMKSARNALQNVSDEALAEPFYLKNNGQVVFTSPKKDNISSSINHLVHHRGQLTVYMRLKDIPVPAIYGPSADDRGF
ncbi:MAG TPA: DinB family protein [Patescibacteria group bacterium]